MKTMKMIKRKVFKSLWKVLGVKNLTDLSFVGLFVALLFVFLFLGAITADETSMVYKWLNK